MKKTLFVLTLFMLTFSYAQEENQQTQDTLKIPDVYLNPYKYIPKMKVFLDCPRCDMSHVQQTLGHIDFVRDQKFANVHIITRVQLTGSGGEEFELEFTGKGDYENIYHKAKFATLPTQSFTEKRNLMIDNIRLGLISFRVSHFAKYQHIIDEAIAQEKTGVEDPVQVLKPKEENPINEDKWNRWVFNIGLNGSLNGQEASQNYNIGSNLSAKRVTKKNKFLFRGEYSFRESKFTLGDIDVVSNEKTIAINLYDAFSLTEHWSLGTFADIGSSTFENKKTYISFKPAIEYSFFDYKEANTKQITLSYRVGGLHNRYFETTIFTKDKEFLWEQSLELSGSVRQPWGNLTGSVVYDSFLNDTSLHAFNFRLGTNFRVTSGLSFNVNGNYSITNNQINLSGGDLSVEELLLRQQQVKSGYNFFVSIGLNYSFGSVFSSIVNPRFGF
jgi:hypothetical protein